MISVENPLSKCALRMLRYSSSTFRTNEKAFSTLANQRSGTGVAQLFGFSECRPVCPQMEIVPSARRCFRRLVGWAPDVHLGPRPIVQHEHDAMYGRHQKPGLASVLGHLPGEGRPRIVRTRTPCLVEAVVWPVIVFRASCWRRSHRRRRASHILHAAGAIDAAQTRFCVAPCHITERTLPPSRDAARDLPRSDAGPPAGGAGESPLVAWNDQLLIDRRPPSLRGMPPNGVLRDACMRAGSPTSCGWAHLCTRSGRVCRAPLARRRGGPRGSA